MKALTCAAARRRLHAFHDRELSVGDQIAVAAHLEWCSECAETFADLRLVGAALRTIAPGRQTLSREEAAGFTAAVVSRLDAEHDQSFLVRVHDMFDDMHLVYAGLGATAATLVCVVIMLGMMRFATRERPDSLAAIVNILANPGSNANPVAIDARVQMPRALDGALSASRGAGRCGVRARRRRHARRNDFEPRNASYERTPGRRPMRKPKAR